MTKLTGCFRALFVFICYVISAPSFAADIYWASGGFNHATYSESCTASHARMRASTGSLKPYGGVNISTYGGGMPLSVQCLRVAQADPEIKEAFSSTSRQGSTCIAPKVLNTATGSCESPPECQTGSTMVNGQCVPDEPDEPVCKAGEKWVVSVTSPGVPKNHGGCAVAIVQLLQCYTSGTLKYCKWEVERTGAKAEADVPDSQPPPNTTPPPVGPRVPSPPMEDPTPGKGCPLGTVQAGSTASGTPICIGTGTDPQAPPTSQPGTTSSSSSPPVTTTDSAGNQTTTQLTTKSNTDGSITTTTTTTVVRPDGSTEVSASNLTSAKPDGSGGLSDGDKESKGFCEQNPTLSVCRESSVSGTCGQIACSGDAIQCATLRAVAADECRSKKFEDDLNASPLKTLGDAAAAGNDPIKATFPTPANGVTVDGPASLDSSGWLGGGQCFADKTFTVQGQSMTISFSKACELLLILRYALMVVGALVSFRILSGAILN